MFERHKDRIIVKLGPATLKLSKRAVTLSVGSVQPDPNDERTADMVMMYVERHMDRGWCGHKGRVYVGYVGAFAVLSRVSGGVLLYNLQPAPVKVAAS